jgi:hypothetical protein
MTKIYENDNYIWNVTNACKGTILYARTKGFNNLYVSLAESKIDKSQDYVLLEADEAGKTQVIFAATTMEEVVSYIDGLKKEEE